ncbi:PREDICTED: zinc finger protein 511 [Elephantulus edwardii]|uniref:zinc finger protein 511 n=1 Tax=Elephantulus edwardii TaxID=28737 RepID=UPI0003F0A5B5|nr:PREDICTED: zinc finger protein 511 [Elephantulus edwardii]
MSKKPGKHALLSGKWLALESKISTVPPAKDLATSPTPAAKASAPPRARGLCLEAGASAGDGTRRAGRTPLPSNSGVPPEPGGGRRTGRREGGGWTQGGGTGAGPGRTGAAGSARSRGDGDVQRHLYLQNILTQVAEVPEGSKVPEFPCQVAGCSQAFDTLESYEHHYHTLHRSVCSICKRAFPSSHLLDSHLLEWHDSFFQVLAEKQDMYQCLVEGCEEKFKTSRDRKDHMVRHHLYPTDFRFDKPKKNKGYLPATAEALGSHGEHSEGDVMEVCSEGHEMPPTVPVGETELLPSRVPATICFGQGASRGFRSTKRSSKQH